MDRPGKGQRRDHISVLAAADWRAGASLGRPCMMLSRALPVQEWKRLWEEVGRFERAGADGVRMKQRDWMWGVTERDGPSWFRAFGLRKLYKMSQMIASEPFRMQPHYAGNSFNDKRNGEKVQRDRL